MSLVCSPLPPRGRREKTEQERGVKQHISDAGFPDNLARFIMRL